MGIIYNDKEKIIHITTSDAIELDVKNNTFI